MSESNIDLGALLKFIVENKKFKYNLKVDHNCMVKAKDPKPLIKILNYLINYLTQSSKDPIEISLTEQKDSCLLCFIISTDEQQLPPVSQKLEAALRPFNAALRIVFEKGMYAQFLIHFCQGKIPENVTIEV